MSRATKSVAAHELARRMKDIRDKVLSGFYIKEGILSCNVKIVPVDPTKVDATKDDPEIKDIPKDHCFIYVNEATYKKIKDNHDLQEQLVQLYDTKEKTLPKKSWKDYFMKPLTRVLLLQVYTETAGSGFGLVKYMQKHGLEETKKMLLEKYASQEKKKKGAKDVNDKIQLVNEVAKLLHRIASAKVEE